MSLESIVSGGIDISRVRGLLFDIDGTLSDTDDHMADRLSRFLRVVAWLFRDRDPLRFARWFVRVVETPANFLLSLADRLGIDKPLTKFFNWLLRKRRARKSQLDRFWLIPGIREMLAELRGRFPLAVVSARDAETTALFLEQFGLLDYFDVVVTAHSCEHTKPFPDPVLFAAQQLGLDPATCLMIGDTVVDVMAGKAAGAQTVAVLCGFGSERELTRAGANLILSTTPDLARLLTK